MPREPRGPSAPWAPAMHPRGQWLEDDELAQRRGPNGAGLLQWRRRALTSDAASNTSGTSFMLMGGQLQVAT